MTHALKFITMAALLTVVTGCEVGPDYHAPGVRVPDSFAVPFPTTRPTTEPATTALRAPAEMTRWWEAFGDAELNSLITRAVAANPDIETVMTRLQEVRTQEAVIRGGTLPRADMLAAAGRGSGSDSTRGRVPSVLTSATNTKGLREITEVVGFDAGWELDLFGRQRRSLEAVAADVQAGAEYRNSVLITVVSDVARAYMDARAFNERLLIARDNVRAQAQTLDLVQTRFNRGLTNELDVALAARQLATARSQVQPLEAAMTAAQSRVAVLIGTYPDDLAVELNRPSPTPRPPAQIRTGLPVELLQRRPDIRQAERQLAAATARIGIATADLYPTVGVSAATGFQGQGLGRPPGETRSIWSAGPYAYWPVLDFGTLDALVSIQDLRTHEALINYRKTILDAVEEVNDAMAGYASQRDRLHNLDDAVTASQRAVSLATERYERGLTDFLNVLDAQRQYYDLADQYATAREQVAVQFIAIYKGLGGGWEDFPPGSPPPAPRPAIIAAVERALHPN